ncbi:hypothetical protein EY643_01040 [Halioglobus maricola]|uniref:DUF4760 domain-containing protein n=1 Tax=Halioglobus maricola TaxID=2601894 RepID=A0A5P9NFQ2_9GAMM|nr:hypothetical protein [Halioglobus maricola]QFU74346.1 hypothetical protein EY643_01040 [Halioglobus maricola]
MTDIPLSTWAAMAEIIGAGSIITGLLVVLFQIRQFRVQQRNAVAINLAQTFYSPDLAQALSLMQNVPDGISLAEIRARGPEYEQAAITVCTSFETMGLLVHEKIAPMGLVLDLAGGIVSTMSRKLARWQEDLREEQQQPSWGEWFEWLGDQARAIKHEQPPAHIRLDQGAGGS